MDEYFSWQALLKNAQEDEELARDVADAFLEETPNIYRQLEQAIQDQDATLANRYAHTIKGSLRTLGAPSSEVAARLEVATHEENWEQSQIEYATLGESFPQVVEAVKSKLNS